MIAHTSNPSRGTGRQIAEIWYILISILPVREREKPLYPFRHFRILGFVSSVFFLDQSGWKLINFGVFVLFFLRTCFCLHWFFFSFCLFSFIAPHLPCLLLLTWHLICFFLRSYKVQACFTLLWPENVLWMIFVLLNLSRLVCTLLAVDGCSLCIWREHLLYICGGLPRGLVVFTRLWRPYRLHSVSHWEHARLESLSEWLRACMPLW